MLRKLHLLVLLFISVSVFAQSKVVTIVDAASGESIPYANIKIGNSLNTVSNSEGKFSLSIADDELQKSVLVSYI